MSSSSSSLLPLHLNNHKSTAATTPSTHGSRATASGTTQRPRLQQTTAFPTKFRSSSFQPRRILAQMLLLQSLFYLSMGLLVLLSDLFSGTPISLDQLLSAETVRADTAAGWLLLAAHLGTAAVGSWLLAWIVGRAKLCLDFTCTVYFWHAILCWLYMGHFPGGITWWLLQILAAVLMTSLGEYWCLQRELEPILIGGGSSSGVGGNGTRSGTGASLGGNGKQRKSDAAFHQVTPFPLESILTVPAPPPPASSSHAKTSDKVRPVDRIAVVAATGRTRQSSASAE